MSLIEETIAEITNNHSLNPDTDYRKSTGDCKLRSGLETNFVSLTADYLLEAVDKRTKDSICYHHWVYMPSRRAEGVTGYDLSFGHFNRTRPPRRVRSMHKLLLSWCDNRRCRTFNPDNRDHNHLEVLIESCSRNSPTGTQILPFLVIHLCGCVHEYRRMGLKVQNFVIPDIESLLRTVVIPLEEIANLSDPLEEISVRYYRDTYQRWENEGPQEYLDRIADPENHHAVVLKEDDTLLKLPVFDLVQWRDHVLGFLLHS